MNQHQSQFPNHQSELNYALSDEPILLNGMKVLFDQQASVYPVDLQLKDRKLINTSLAKSLGNNNNFSGALNLRNWKDVLGLNITYTKDKERITKQLNEGGRLELLASYPWNLNQALDGTCGFASTIMAMIFLAGNEAKRQEVIRELLNAIYHSNEYKKMTVTKEILVKKGRINVLEIKPKQNIAKVESKTKTTVNFAWLKYKDESIEVILNNDYKKIPVKKGSIQIKSDDGLVNAKAVDGVIKDRIVKRFIAYQADEEFSNEEDEIETRTIFEPKFTADYILNVGLMLFFKDYFKNHVDQNMQAIWKRNMEFNTIFEGFEEQAKQWKKNNIKKLKDIITDGEKVIPGYKKGDLGLTQEGVLELCKIVGIFNKESIVQPLSPKEQDKDESAKRTWFISINQEKMIDNWILVKSNKDFFKPINFPCILGLTRGDMFLKKEEKEEEKKRQEKESNFSKFNFVEHWVFMPNSNEIWSWGFSMKKESKPTNNQNKYLDKLIADGSYYIPAAIIQLKKPR